MEGAGAEGAHDLIITANGESGANGKRSPFPD